ncbi:MAG: rRNA maturation RNase YbeY [Chloroflexi bacterium 44-23]|nr:MAG: rRNA maturation RNase YbeY [Chloroflexi bacterium 44-23]
MESVIVEIANPHKYPIVINPSLLINTVLNFQNFHKNAEVSLSFINEAKISKLYKQYFGYAHVTDVLSFPSGEINPENGHIYLGDILIAYPFVVKQAKTLGNELSDELSLLIIHGLLHLLGFDHDTKEKNDEMWALQKEIMKALEIQITRFPE